MLDTINFRSPKTLGCSVASSVILQSLREKFTQSEIVVYTKTPDLFMGLTGIDKLVDLNNETGLANYDVDLKDYLDITKPQFTEPFRHLIDHMFEITEKQLGSQLAGNLNRDFAPKVNLSSGEITWAKDTVVTLSQGKPLIWIQTKSRFHEKDAPTALWQDLINRCSDRYSFLDLSQGQYSRRQAIAITQAAAGGITLDTFLLHGSEAVHARNVIVLLVSSHREVVCYSDQTCLANADDSTSHIVDDIVNALDNCI